MNPNDIPDDVRAVARLGTGAAERRAALRGMIDSRQTIVVPGITDAMGALLAQLGFTTVLYANFLMRAMMKAGQQALAHLCANGETASYADKIATWEERQRLFRLPEFTAAGEFYDQAELRSPERRS